MFQVARCEPCRTIYRTESPSDLARFIAEHRHEDEDAPEQAEFVLEDDEEDDEDTVIFSEDSELSQWLNRDKSEE